MDLSIEGMLVFGVLLLFGYALGSPVIIGLFASLPLGSTAIVTVTALGGSSPLVFTAFTLILLASVLFRKRVLHDLAVVFHDHWSAWVVAVLILYCIFGAISFPRLFEGAAIVFIPSPRGVHELPLAPVSGNITQTSYFVVGALTFFAFAILLGRGARLDVVRTGFLAWVILHASLGVLDLLGKMSGAGDILGPIRTASYAYLVEVEEAGFWRIAGGYAEASAFGGVTLACLAFTYTYWRISHSISMLMLTIILFVLLILSTSSTAYAGLAIVAPFAMATIAVAALRAKISKVDIICFGFAGVGLTAVLTTHLIDAHLFDPITRLFDTMVLNKAMSESAQARGLWNLRSIESFFTTLGLGVGLGSSRASSWVIAVVSQLGALGALLMATLVGVLLWDMVAPKPKHADRETLALVSGARSSVLASLAGASVSGGFADPGLLFFIALAVVVVYRKHVALQPAMRSL
jgi:hypothetical protein